ncbi:diguanylate cyclase/phosphodiesterase (GGDEF & EAL domains) with PAS/PAC sensor(s) [hydrothermal vent metagenome]|uniref:Diguanylate cyclase/phosphodiesterase (GGDEF & EAL domains) with PAS/PAC sensor(S) n=1 Tax=hydrothermal vent metagenome TaxID=652676 RepID=A0A3B1C9K1_9ZZZZ
MSHKPLDPSAPITIFTDRQRLSYATIGRLFRLSLESAGLNVDDRQTEADKQEDVNIADENITGDYRGQTVLHNTIGLNFRPIPGAFNIALPAHEWSRYPKGWVENLNSFDEAWVTTSHVHDILINSGVNIPVLFLPPALEIDSPPQKTDWVYDGPVKFFSCGEPHFRKGFHLLMEGYMLAFPNPDTARLYIKTSRRCQWRAPREDIFIITEDMERESMLAMYQGCDVYITASLGEGLGLPVAEATMAKTPVMANYWGGHKSVLKDGSFWLIDHTEVDQYYCSDPRFYAVDQKCGFSSPSMIARAIETVVNSSAEQRKQMANEARKNILATYGKHVAVERFRKRFGLRG